MSLKAVVGSIDPKLQIWLADIGSAGGLHARWRSFRPLVSAMLFDPLDSETEMPRDRHIPVALAGQPGTVGLYVTDRASMSSTLTPNAELLDCFWDKPQHTRIVRAIDLPCDTLDRIVAKTGVRPDAIKIDVQGGEFNVLSGARTTLSSCVMLAEIEVSFIERYRGLRKFSAIVDLMEALGFELIDLTRLKRYRYRNDGGVVNPGIARGSRAGRLAFCDALFLLREERLDERMVAPEAALKAFLLILVYGKADIAAHFYDRCGAGFPAATRRATESYLRGLKGWRFGPAVLHRAFDYLASKV